MKLIVPRLTSGLLVLLLLAIATVAQAGPRIAISGMRPIANGTTTPAVGDGTDLGRRPLHSPPNTLYYLGRDFLITNQGDAPLLLTNNPRVKLSGPDAADFLVNLPIVDAPVPPFHPPWIPYTPPPPEPFEVAAGGGTTRFSVVFAPNVLTAGVRQATVTVESNDPNNGSYSFAVQATVTTLDVAVALESFNKLVFFDPAGDSIETRDVPVTGVAEREWLVALATRPATGALLAFAVEPNLNQGTLYTVVPATGVATPIGTPGSIALVDRQGNPIPLTVFTNTHFDMTVNPVTDEVRVVTSDNVNFRIDPVTGLPVDGDFGTGLAAGVNPDAPFSGVASDALRGAAYTNSTTGATTAALYTLEWFPVADEGPVRRPPLITVRGGARIVGRGPSGPLLSRTLGITFDVFNAYGYLQGFAIPANVTVAASDSLAPAGYGYALIRDGYGDCEIVRIELSTGATLFRKKLGRALFGLALLATPFEPAKLAPAYPTARNVTEHLATLGGEVTGDGGTGFIDAGIIVAKTSENADPKIGDPHVTVRPLTASLGAFAYQVTGLLPETQYSFRIYASNTPDRFEVAYSVVATFTTTKAPAFEGETDFVVSTGGDRLLNPLRNDGSPTGHRLQLIGVNDPSIAIRGQSLLIPAGYTGTFHYYIWDGTQIGQAAVVVNRARPQTVYSSLLHDRVGAVVGSAEVAFAPSMHAATVVLKVRSSVVRLLVSFPANIPIASRPTAFGLLYVATSEDGQLYLDLIPTPDDGRLAGTLQPRHTAGARTRYHLALADSAGVLRGGGFGMVTVLPNAGVILTALLPDGSVFSSSTSLREDMMIPVFASIGRGVLPRATVDGELVLADLAASDLSGEWNWRKPQQRAAVRGLYLDGVNALLSAYGSSYDGQIAIDGPGVLGIDGGDLAPQDELGENVAITAGRPNLPLGILKSWVTFPKYGIFYVDLEIPGRPGIVKGRGVYLPKSHTAGGFFPGTTVGGRIVLSP